MNKLSKTQELADACIHAPYGPAALQAFQDEVPNTAAGIEYRPLQ